MKITIPCDEVSGIQASFNHSPRMFVTVEMGRYSAFAVIEGIMRAMDPTGETWQKELAACLVRAQGRPVYTEVVRGIVQTPHNYLEFAREVTNDAGSGKDGQWNNRYLRGLDARGLCLGSMPTTPDFTKYPYPSGLPWFVPCPISDEPDPWPRESVVLWKEAQ